MTKRGFLSNEEKSFIDRHFESLQLGDMAKALDRTEEQIKKYLEEKNKGGEVQAAKPKESPVDKMMAKSRRNGKVEATIMTQGASELIDMLSKKTNRLSTEMHEAIHKPRG